MPDRTDRGIPLAQLEEAVARGILTAAQLDAVRQLAEPAEAVGNTPAEARRGLNVVTIAYYVGAAAVVFAFGWYIVERWEMLGAGGVLIVSLVYAAVFALASRVIGRAGFRTASSVAAVLAVAMTPLVAWSALKLAGLWYEPGSHAAVAYVARVDVLEHVRWIPVELATALAALVALRRVPFAILALPAAVVVPLVVGDAMPLFLDPIVVDSMGGWIAFVSAAVLLAIGYAVERHPRDGEDYARWVYLTGLVTMFVALISVWDQLGLMHHALPALAVGLFALALFLRRPAFAVFATLEFIGYLGYLAFDVFRAALSFPIVLATFGISVIVVTVLLQQRYPALAREVEHRQAGRREVPHAGLVFGGAIVVAMALAAAQLPDAHERAADAWTRSRRMALRAHAMKRRLEQDSLRATPSRRPSAPPR